MQSAVQSCTFVTGRIKKHRKAATFPSHAINIDVQQNQEMLNELKFWENSRKTIIAGESTITREGKWEKTRERSEQDDWDLCLRVFLTSRRTASTAQLLGLCEQGRAEQWILTWQWVWILKWSRATERYDSIHPAQLAVSRVTNEDLVKHIFTNESSYSLIFQEQVLEHLASASRKLLLVYPHCTEAVCWIGVVL